MKKIFLSFLSFCLFNTTVIAQQKPLTPQEAKTIAHTVNSTLKDMANSIEKMNWTSLEDLIQNTATIVGKHVDASIKIAQSIDKKQIEEHLNTISNTIEKQIDTKQLAKDVEQLAEKIKVAVEKETSK